MFYMCYTNFDYDTNLPCDPIILNGVNPEKKLSSFFEETWDRKFAIQCTYENTKEMYILFRS